MQGLHNILMDDRLLQKTDSQKREQEILVFKALSVMLLVISGIGAFSALIYSLIIFKSIPVAIFIAVFLFLILFNLFRLMLITSINSYHTLLGVFQSDHSLAYLAYLPESDNRDAEDLKMQEAVNSRKDQLREYSKTKGKYKPNLAQRLTFLMKMLFFAFLAVFFANGIELLMFSGQINESLEIIKQVYANQPDSWLLKSALNPGESGFWIVNSHSVLLSIKVLSMGLGSWKIYIDGIFVLIFIIPLFLTYRSRKIFDSEYVRELALHEISISYYHHLITDSAIIRIEEQINKMNISDTSISENQFKS